MIKLHKPELNCLQATIALSLSIPNTEKHMSPPFFKITLTTKKQKILTHYEYMVNGLLNAWAIAWASH